MASKVIQNDVAMDHFADTVAAAVAVAEMKDEHTEEDKRSRKLVVVNAADYNILLVLVAAAVTSR